MIFYDTLKHNMQLYYFYKVKIIYWNYYKKSIINDNTYSLDPDILVYIPNQSYH